MAPILWGVGVWASPADAAVDPRRAADLYREAFSLVGDLPRDADEFVRTATRESVGRLERALELTREAARAGSVDWGVDWAADGEGGIDFDLPGQARNLARLGVAYHHEKIRRGDFARFAGDMVALIRMGQHFTQNQPLIYYLTAIATEGIVRAEIVRHARNLPAGVRSELLGLLEAMPPGPTLLEVFEVEKAINQAIVRNVVTGEEGFPPGHRDTGSLVQEHRALDAHDSDIRKLERLMTMNYRDLPSPEGAAEELSSYWAKGQAPTLINVRRIEIISQAERELLLAGLNYFQNPGAALPASRVTGDQIRMRRQGDTIIFESSSLRDPRAHRRGELVRLEFPSTDRGR